jgi:hypothetical protein
VERSPPEVGEDVVGDTHVVGDEVALRQASGREERLVGVGDVDGRSIVEVCWERATRSST